MCLSIPGKVIEMSKNRYTIEYPDEKRILHVSLVQDLNIGDYVIVSNKIIVTKVSPENAKKFFELVGG